MYTTGLLKAACASSVRHGDRVEQRRFGMHHAHAASAAAAGRLDDDRVADAARDLDDLGGVIRQRAVHAGHAGHAGLLHRVLGGDLVAHQADGLGARADEHETALFHALGKVGVFRQEAIAGVDGLRIGHFRRADDGGDVQIALRRRRRADAHRFVGQLDVFGVGVGLGMHRHGLDAHFAAGALDAQGDFAAVGDQDFFKHAVSPW